MLSRVFSSYKKYLLESITLLLFHYQSVEASVKGIMCCTLSGRDEIEMHLLSSMKSILCHDTKNNALNDNDHKLRNKKNANAEDYVPEKALNKNIIKNVANFYPSTMSNEELNHCERIVRKEEYFKKERTTELVDLMDRKNIVTKMIIARCVKVVQHSAHSCLALCSLANLPRNINLSCTKNLMPGELLMNLNMVHACFVHLCRRMNIAN